MASLLIIYVPKINLKKMKSNAPLPSLFCIYKVKEVIAMAATENLTDSSLRMTFDTGVDAKGEPIFKYKTLSKVKTSATAAQLYAIASALHPLQAHNLTNVERKDSSVITGP
jgi:hypothetical protein